MTDQPRLQRGHESERKAAAAVVWALYILSIPSVNMLVLVGLVVAYAARGSATGVARAHIDAQIALFWSVFWWTVGLWILAGVSFVSIIGIPLGYVFLFLLLILSIWFTVKSIFGILALAGDRAP